ncbi:MAG: hypothetical protein AAGC63_05025, partial [Propionicimonas sp.]|nr:hypothetical protein [Propionicimonas sp.]
MLAPWLAPGTSLAPGRSAAPVPAVVPLPPGGMLTAGGSWRVRDVVAGGAGHAARGVPARRAGECLGARPSGTDHWT